MQLLYWVYLYPKNREASNHNILEIKTNLEESKEHDTADNASKTDSIAYVVGGGERGAFLKKDRWCDQHESREENVEKGCNDARIKYIQSTIEIVQLQGQAQHQT